MCGMVRDLTRHDQLAPNLVCDHREHRAKALTRPYCFAQSSRWSAPNPVSDHREPHAKL
jgi:hypothetical protein